MSKNKRCFLVVGGQSSGTRMMVRSLILSGVPEIKIPLDTEYAYGKLPPLPEGDFALHRGMPIGGVWTHLWSMSKRLRHEGFAVIPIVMTRDWNATAQSQVRRGYVNDVEQAVAQLRAAYIQITQSLEGYVFVSYEQYCLSSAYRRILFEGWGLPESPIDIHEANSQYY